jgi:acyl-CoA thioester hydrolase
MDSLGHINNVIFFRYVESGRIAYIDHVLGNDPDVWGGEGPILADIGCQFLRQLRYPADIDVGTRTVKFGTKSLTLEAEIFLRGEDAPVARSRAVVVWFNYGQQRSVAVPDRVRSAITLYEHTTPEN